MFCLSVLFYFVLFGNKSHPVAQVGLHLTAIFRLSLPSAGITGACYHPLFLPGKFSISTMEVKTGIQNDSPPDSGTCFSSCECHCGPGQRLQNSDEQWVLPVPPPTPPAPCSQHYYYFGNTRHGASVQLPLLFTLSLSFTLVLHFSHRSVLDLDFQLPGTFSMAIRFL